MTNVADRALHDGIDRFVIVHHLSISRIFSISRIDRWTAHVTW